MNKIIYILDDDLQMAQGLQKQLSKVPAIAATDYRVEAYSVDQFTNDLTQLEKRASGKKTSDIGFDKAAVLVIDYDIAKLPHASLLTGERVAYLVRCFSNCGLIIALNQFGPNSFDLTLNGHPESFADLNLGDSQLISRGLWSNQWNGFRPWHWPLVVEAYESFEKRIKKVTLSDRIFDTLGFPPQVVRTLPSSAIAWIAPKTKMTDIEGVTFQDFLDQSPHGLKPKANRTNANLQRMACARVSKWLERIVLPGQNILVDAPHLVARFPSLLGKKPTVKVLNAICKLGVSANLELDPAIEAHRFKAKDWLSRPAWFWESVRGSEEIKEVREPWSKEELSHYFCEDLSAFLPAEKCTEFVAAVPSPFTRRFVARTPDVEYTPALQFAL